MNAVSVVPAGRGKMKTVRGTHYISREHPELLRDESSLSGGNCQAAAWPEDIQDSRTFLGECMDDQVPVTISGARTGITGGAVPMGGAVLSTERLRGIQMTDRPGIIRVMAGETIDSVGEYCRRNVPGFFYPPDPTEATASVGGTVATDASGSSGYRYGSTRRWINRITVVLPSGNELAVKRGEHKFNGLTLDHPLLGRLELPCIDRPRPSKNAAGLYIEPDMDLIDLFIGSEGRLGLILNADLILTAKPDCIASMAAFCDEKGFWALRDELLRTKMPVRELEAMTPPCLEFLGRNTGIPAHPPGEWVLITSIEASSEEDLDAVIETMAMLLEENGISSQDTWGGFDDAERARLKEFRHLLPETVNRLIADISSADSAIHKVSTDTAVPPELLRPYYGYMRSMLDDSGVEYVVFGHCGQGHLHANLIPTDTAGLAASETAMELIAARAVSLGGTVSAEHGTGKLKAPLLRMMYSRKELEQTDLLIKRICAC